MEPCLLNHFILNDELKSTCDFNPTLLEQGRGIYEVFRVINGVPLFLDEHLKRFYRSIELGDYSFKLSEKQLKSRFKVLLESNALKVGNVQFHLIEHPDIGNLFMAWVSPHRYPSADEYKNGVDLMSLHAVRNNPHLKSTNLPARLLANKVISEEEVYEVLLVDDNNVITEGSRSNIFFINDSKLVTPALSLVLDGITRSEVIKVALVNKIEMHNTVIPFEDIELFDAAFLTSTSMKVLPVRQLDNHTFHTRHPLILKLQQLYEERIREDLEMFEWK
jgi:branched-chain amino acid aminotransferase